MKQHKYAITPENDHPTCECGKTKRIWVNSEGQLIINDRPIFNLPGERTITTITAQDRNKASKAILKTPFSMTGEGRNSKPHMLSVEGEKIYHTHHSRKKVNSCRACITWLQDNKLKDYPKR